MKKNLLSILKIFDMVLFVSAIILQNFAIITTSSFGIAFSTAVLVYFFFRYKAYKDITKRLVLFVCIMGGLLVGNGFFNGSLKWMSYIRIMMVIFDIWVAYVYVNKLDGEDRRAFLKIFKVGFVLMCLYGLYEYVAQMNGWPRFLNYFSNNPSYGIRDIYAQNLGWSNSNRIFGCFLEPSFYSVFLVFGYILLLKFGKMKTIELSIITILFSMNIIMASARTGFLFLIFIIFMMLLSKYSKGRMNYLLKIICVLVPMIILLLTHTIGLTIFKDSSIEARSYSSVYYLNDGFSSVETAFFGHGAGSIINNDQDLQIDGHVIEKHAHNGYIELFYQYGLAMVVFVVGVLCLLLNKLPRQNQIFMYAVVFMLFSTGELFNVETFAIMASVLYGFSKWK